MLKRAWEKRFKLTKEWVDRDMRLLGELAEKLRATNVSMSDSRISAEVRLEYNEVYEQMCALWDKMNKLRTKVCQTTFPG
jgi:hypothetical protein